MARRGNRIDLSAEDPEDTRPSIEIPLMASQHSETDTFDGFLAEISRLNSNITRIKSNAERVVQLQTASMLQMDNRGAAQELDMLADSTRALLQQTRAGIRALNEQTKRMGNPNNRRSQEAALAKKLSDAAKDFKDAEERVSTQHKERLSRQYKIVRPDATDYEINRAIKDGGAVFAQQLISPRQEQRQALQEVQARNVEIQKIEKQVVELFELMQEMSRMIDEQQVMINVSEEYIEEADQKLKVADEEIDRAIGHATEVRKSKWKIFAIVGAVIVVLIIILLIWLNSIGAFKGSGKSATASVPTPTPTIRLVRRENIEYLGVNAIYG
ncbi:Plasma membrane t-SNARE, secretory vesicle fusion [Nowakowskiella sp. JEL0407]|nr:Plasma membrane t-SNARE, secretory vesicle fusion [Nowakowskiella sp. JEL0407]